MVRTKKSTEEVGTPAACLLPAHLRSKTRLRRAEASEFLLVEYGIQCAPRTLAKLASVGGGPRFQKFNNCVLYPVAELRAWAEAKLGRLQSSTSDTREY